MNVKELTPEEYETLVGWTVEGKGGRFFHLTDARDSEIPDAVSNAVGNVPNLKLHHKTWLGEGEAVVWVRRTEMQYTATEDGRSSRKATQQEISAYHNGQTDSDERFWGPVCHNGFWIDRGNQWV